jgi:hypothetical protein
MAERPDEQGQHRLVPLRVNPVDPPSILRPLIYRDLFGLPETKARTELLAAVKHPSQRGKQVPFPGSGEPDGDELSGPLVPGTITGGVERAGP